MEKGILTLEQEKTLASLVDETIKLKGVLEFIDGYVFKAVITFIDDTYVDKLKEEIKVQLAAVVDAIMKNDVALAEELAGDLINNLVDIPGLDEDTEGLLFKGVIEILVAAILNWISNKKGEVVKLKIMR